MGNEMRNGGHDLMVQWCVGEWEGEKWSSRTWGTNNDNPCDQISRWPRELGVGERGLALGTVPRAHDWASVRERGLSIEMNINRSHDAHQCPSTHRVTNSGCDWASTELWGTHCSHVFSLLNTYLPLHCPIIIAFASPFFFFSFSYTVIPLPSVKQKYLF